MFRGRVNALAVAASQENNAAKITANLLALNSHFEKRYTVTVDEINECAHTIRTCIRQINLATHAPNVASLLNHLCGALPNDGNDADWIFTLLTRQYAGKTLAQHTLAHPAGYAAIYVNLLDNLRTRISPNALGTYLFEHSEDGLHIFAALNCNRPLYTTRVMGQILTAYCKDLEGEGINLTTQIIQAMKKAVVAFSNKNIHQLYLDLLDKLQQKGRPITPYLHIMPHRSLARKHIEHMNRELDASVRQNNLGLLTGEVTDDTADDILTLLSEHMHSGKVYGFELCSIGPREFTSFYDLVLRLKTLNVDPAKLRKLLERPEFHAELNEKAYTDHRLSLTFHGLYIPKQPDKVLKRALVDHLKSIADSAERTNALKNAAGLGPEGKEHPHYIILTTRRGLFKPSKRKSFLGEIHAELAAMKPATNDANPVAASTKSTSENDTCAASSSSSTSSEALDFHSYEWKSKYGDFASIKALLLNDPATLTEKLDEIDCHAMSLRAYLFATARPLPFVLYLMLERDLIRDSDIEILDDMQERLFALFTNELIPLKNRVAFFKAATNRATPIGRFMDACEGMSQRTVATLGQLRQTTLAAVKLQASALSITAVSVFPAVPNALLCPQAPKRRQPQLLSALH